MNSQAVYMKSFELSQSERIVAVHRLTEFLQANEQEVLNLLTEHAGYAAAVSELQGAIKALQGAEQELQRHLRGQVVDCIAVFMPSNMVLYFYVLYLIIPSLYSQRVLFRPSSHIVRQTERLHLYLQPVHRLPVSMQLVSQRVFLAESVLQAQLVVFTGSYVNAEQIRHQLLPEKQTYVFFGQGVNPAIVGDQADLRRAVKDLISARMFNTGQDCMGPNVLFVSRKQVGRFNECLQEGLSRLVFGPRNDPVADYNPIFYMSTLSTLSQYLTDNGQFIEFGGSIDFAQRKIVPTVLRGCLERRAPVMEYFGPIFHVVDYADEASLMLELDSSFYRDRAMGASVYGSPALAEFLRSNHMVAVDQSLFDIENGNQPFGGCGQMANYVFHARRVKQAPILLSQVVGEHF